MFSIVVYTTTSSPNINADIPSIKLSLKNSAVIPNTIIAILFLTILFLGFTLYSLILFIRPIMLHTNPIGIPKNPNIKAIPESPNETGSSDPMKKNNPTVKTNNAGNKHVITTVFCCSLFF